jgi:AmiR/NasT family two-component response regulator
MIETASQRKQLLGEAAGVIAARYNVTGQHAAQMLRDASRDGRRKLDDVIEDVIVTGALGNDDS